MKRKILLTSLLFIVGLSAFAQTECTALSVKGDVIMVYVQAAIMGLFLSLVMVGVVSMINYDLIDNRIRKQRDVRKRRITFFTFMLLLPSLWFCYLFYFSYDAQAGIIGTYFVNMIENGFALKKLLQAYCYAGPFILMASYFLFFILFSWLFARYLNKYKARTVVYSNFQYFGIIGKKATK